VSRISGRSALIVNQQWVILINVIIFLSVEYKCNDVD